ncbi:MAG: hypothetical protein KBD15_03225 [Candidatus Magasanikbacteria bacterium]|nr:hypothetical protein [Candidatus Magasanikbacteria bacterium]
MGSNPSLHAAIETICGKNLPPETLELIERRNIKVEIHPHPIHTWQMQLTLTAVGFSYEITFGREKLKTNDSWEEKFFPAGKKPKTPEYEIMGIMDEQNPDAISEEGKRQTKERLKYGISDEETQLPPGVTKQALKEIALTSLKQSIGQQSPLFYAHRGLDSGESMFRTSIRMAKKLEATMGLGSKKSSSVLEMLGGLEQVYQQYLEEQGSTFRQIQHKVDGLYGDILTADKRRNAEDEAVLETGRKKAETLLRKKEPRTQNKKDTSDPTSKKQEDALAEQRKKMEYTEWATILTNAQQLSDDMVRIGYNTQISLTEQAQQHITLLREFQSTLNSKSGESIVRVREAIDTKIAELEKNITEWEKRLNPSFGTKFLQAITPGSREKQYLFESEVRKKIRDIFTHFWSYEVMQQHIEPAYDRVANPHLYKE